MLPHKKSSLLSLGPWNAGELISFFLHIGSMAFLFHTAPSREFPDAFLFTLALSSLQNSP